MPKPRSYSYTESYDSGRRRLVPGRHYETFSEADHWKELAAVIRREGGGGGGAKEDGME